MSGPGARARRVALVCLVALAACAGGQRPEPSPPPLAPAAMPTRAQPGANSEPARAGPDANCEFAGVPVHVEFLDASGGVALQLQTEAASLPALRERVTQVTEQDHQESWRVPSEAYDRPYSAVAQDIERGIQLTLLPQRHTDLDALRRDVQQDVFAMQRGDCSRLGEILPAAPSETRP